MFSHRNLAVAILGASLIAPWSQAQEKQPETKPGTGKIQIQLDPKTGKAEGALLYLIQDGDSKPEPKQAPKTESNPGSGKAAVDYYQLDLLLKKLADMKGGVILLEDGRTKPTLPNKPVDPAAAIQKALKQLSGPADQLDLREVRKLLTEALGEMKAKPGVNFRVNVGDGIRIAVPPLGSNPMPDGPGAAGWGGPGSAPWMPGMPAPKAGTPQVQQEQIRKEIEMLMHQMEMLKRTQAVDAERQKAEKMIEEKVAAQKRMAELQLEEARRALDKAIKKNQIETLKRVDAIEIEKRISLGQVEEAQKALEKAARDKANAEKEKKFQGVPAQFILRFGSEPANENLMLTRRNGRYVARLIEGNLRITVTGPIQADPKAADAIVIEAGDDVSSYANLAAVPERHRAKVARLLDLARR